MSNEKHKYQNEDQIPDVLNYVGKETPFAVPENFFEDSHRNIMEAVSDIPVSGKESLIVRMRRNPVMAIAASFLVLIMAGAAYALISQVIIPEFRKNTAQKENIVTNENNIKPEEQNDIAPIDKFENRQSEDLISDALDDIQPLNSQNNTVGVNDQDQNNTNTSDQDHGFNSNSGQGFSSSTSNGNNAVVEAATIDLQQKHLYLTDSIVCKGDVIQCSGKLSGDAYKYTWTVNNTTFRSTGNKISINTNKLTYGTHKLSMSIENRRSGKTLLVRNANIKVLPKPSLRIKSDICAYEQATLKAGSNNPTYTYLWSNGSKAHKIKVNKSGKYWVRISNADGGSCYVTDTFNVTIMPDPGKMLGSNINLCVGDEITLNPAVTSDQFKYTWKPNGSRDNSMDFKADKAGTYKISLTIEGCETHRDAITIVVNDCNLEIPNIITPNADGYNDVLIIKGLDQYPNNKLVIFDRSGKVVFESEGYHNEWDGGNLPDGTYYYVLKLGNDQEKSGSITILR